MITTIYRVKCEGPCGRYLNDIIGGQASMTVRPGNALAFLDLREAHKIQQQVFTAGRCPRCTDRREVR